MQRTLMSAGLVLTGLLTCWACTKQQVAIASDQQSNSAQSAAVAGGDLHFKVPDGWLTEKTTSSMRVAQYKLPKAEGDNEDASLVLYYFGASQGGSPQANIDRWISQIENPRDKPRTESLTVNGLKVSLVDATGTYTAEMSPGSGTMHNDANYRLRAAVIETAKGNYYAKLVGPAKTVARWDQSFTDYLKSFEFK